MVSGKCGFEFLSATFDFVTLGKLLNLSELPFYHLQNGNNVCIWGGLSVVIYMEISSIAVSGTWEVLKKKKWDCYYYLFHRENQGSMKECFQVTLSTILTCRI